MKSSFKAYCKTAKYPTFSCCFLSLFGKMFFDFISFLFLIFVFHNFCRSSLLNFCADFPNQNDIIVIIIQHFYLGKTFPGDKDLSSNTDLGTMVNGCTQLSEVLGLNPVISNQYELQAISARYNWVKGHFWIWHPPAPRQWKKPNTVRIHGHQLPHWGLRFELYSD